MSHYRRRGPLAFGLVASALAILFGVDWAQGQVAQLGNSKELKEQYDKISAELNLTINNADKKKTFRADLLDTGAQYWVYRVTWPSVLEAKVDPAKLDPMLQHLKDFNGHIKRIVDAKAQTQDPAFANAYSPVLVTRFRELTNMNVVANPRALSIGLQMLPALAKLQTEGISDYLVELIDPDKGKHDVVKLWAIRALREYMPVETWGEPFDSTLLQNKPKMARKKGDEARIDVLTRFILRPLPANATAEEIGAYRYLRKEALETLGMAGAPAVAAIGALGKVDGPVAPLLVQVLIPKNLMPETTLLERNEAALGLCNMNPKALEKYEPAAAYHYIGSTLAELGTAYNADFPNFVKTDDTRRPPPLPWRITMKRWEQAAGKLVKNSNKDKRAAALEERVKNMVKAVLDPKTPTTINPRDIAELIKLEAAPTESFFLFKNVVKSPELKIPTE